MKYALLIGINYIGTPSELRGCINDAENMKKQLIQQHGYAPENITMLTDHTETKPTKHNILAILQTYTHQQNMSQFFFHYSGHGSYTRDTNKDEKDGKDECLVSIDHQYIIDDELKLIFEKIDASVFCLFDCCHSGTAIDLGFQYEFMKHAWANVGKPSGKQNILMISGCMDKQTSADAYINGNFQGAMTYAYLNAMNRYNHNPTLLQLVLGMRNFLRNSNFSQLPQLNCNKRIEINSKWL